MSLLKQIQDSAADSTSDLSATLRRCKILAARLDSKPLEEWLRWESDGYPAEAELPDYRIWRVSVKGTFIGASGSAWQNARVPNICIPEHIRKTATMFRCHQSIFSLEQVLTKIDGTTFRTELGDLSVVLGTRVYKGYNCVETWSEFESSRVVEVLNAVRNRVLDFALTIEKQYPSAGDPSSPALIDRNMVTQIFNTTMHGGSMNLIGSVDRSAIDLAVRPLDLDDIRTQLSSLGIPDMDIQSLQEALKRDPTPSDPNKFGPRVAEWLGSAISNAASGSWKIGLDVASAVLSKLISKYYGL